MSRRNTPEFHANRKIVLAGDPLCHWCGRNKATECDHLIPWDAGGTDDLSNLVPACKPCNSKRGALYINNKRARQQQARNAALHAKQTNNNTTDDFLSQNTPPQIS